VRNVEELPAEYLVCQCTLSDTEHCHCSASAVQYHDVCVRVCCRSPSHPHRPSNPADGLDQSGEDQVATSDAEGQGTFFFFNRGSDVKKIIYCKLLNDDSPYRRPTGPGRVTTVHFTSWEHGNRRLRRRGGRVQLQYSASSGFLRMT
jgi:hypothetical protein